MNKIQLSDSFNYARLLRFTLPSIVMMIFTSIYGVVDGLFISNVVGSNALSSISIVMPMLVIIGGFGFMLGTGGSAEVSKTLGEGDKKKANEYFTLIIVTIATIGIILSVISYMFIEPICYKLGASELLIEDCVTYGKIILIGCTGFMLQTTFQSFFVVAQKPNIGLVLTVASGVTNMVLDFVFIVVMKMGIAGAAIGTIASFAVGSVIPLFYFALSKESLIHFTAFGPHIKMLLRSSANGLSEMVSNLSMSFVTFLYNKQLMRLAGEDGVAAISVIMYVNMIFLAIFIGYSMGIAPVIGFHYGAGDKKELKSLFFKSLKIIIISSVAMFVLSELVSSPLVRIFLGEGDALSKMTIHAFRLYSLSFLICGFNIFGSAFFTALCNGKVSAIISFLRTFVTEAGTMLILPIFIGIDGVWLSAAAAETVTLAVTLCFVVSLRKKYGYA